MKLQAEYHKIEIISGARRPRRSAIQPAETAPMNAISIVSVPTSTTRVRSAWNSLAIGTIKTKKHGEVEGVQRPAKPGGEIGVPLIPGGFSPPRSAAGETDVYDVAKVSRFSVLPRGASRPASSG